MQSAKQKIYDHYLRIKNMFKILSEGNEFNDIIYNATGGSKNIRKKMVFVSI